MSKWQQKGVSGERWTESEARAAVAAWRASGERMASFARRHGLDRQRFGWWRRRLDEGGSSLVPVTITSSRSPAHEDAVVHLQINGVEQRRDLGQGDAFTHEARQDVGEVLDGVHVDELTRSEERVGDRGSFAAGVRAGE